jgi:hypothetical protein
MDTINLATHAQPVLIIVLLVMTLLTVLLAMIRMPLEMIVTATLDTIEMAVHVMYARINFV